MWPPMCSRSQMRASTFWVAFTCTAGHDTHTHTHDRPSQRSGRLPIPDQVCVTQTDAGAACAACRRRARVRAGHRLPPFLTSRRSVLLLMSPAFIALMVLLVNRSKEAATCPSSASPARLMRAKLSLMRINASSCLRAPPPPAAAGKSKRGLSVCQQSRGTQHERVSGLHGQLLRACP